MANKANSEDDSILREAIAGTEREIFGEAFGQEDGPILDETGDRTREALGEGLEGQHEPDEEEDEGEEAEGKDEAEEPEKVEAKAEIKPEAKEAKPEPPEVDVDSKGRVPSRILRERTETLRAAETERDALKARLEAAEANSRKEVEAAQQNSRKEIDALRAEFMAALRQQQPKPADQPKPAEPPKPDAPPDMFENPTAWAEYLRNGVKADVAAATKAEVAAVQTAMQQQMHEYRVNASMEAAQARHGDTFVKAFAALQSFARDGSPDGRALAQRLTTAPNPGEAVVAWHKRNETLRRVGDDADAYEAKLREDTRKALMADPEFRKTLVEGLRAEAMIGDQGAPRTTVRLPASLNRASGGNTRAPNDLDVFDGSDRAVFDGAFS